VVIVMVMVMVMVMVRVSEDVTCGNVHVLLP
jgi:hypothetical protein